MWNHIGCATANLWNDQFVFIEEVAGREVRRFCFMGVVAFVSFRGCKWIISLPSLYIANTAPRNATGHGRRAGICPI